MEKFSLGFLVELLESDPVELPEIFSVKFREEFPVELPKKMVLIPEFLVELVGIIGGTPTEKCSLELLEVLLVKLLEESSVELLQDFLL